MLTRLTVVIVSQYMQILTHHDIKVICYMSTIPQLKYTFWWFCHFLGVNKGILGSDRKSCMIIYTKKVPRDQRSNYCITNI